MAKKKLQSISTTGSDINADWLKYIKNPKTGKTYRQEELEIHDELAKKYKKVRK